MLPLYLNVVYFRCIFSLEKIELICLKNLVVVRFLLWKIQFWMVSPFQRFSKQMYFWNLENLESLFSGEIVFPSQICRIYSGLLSHPLHPQKC